MPHIPPKYNTPADHVLYIPGKSVKNFTTDWNDGIALCSMVEAVAPGLCPEFNSLNPEDGLENAKLGLDRAEYGLGVPKVRWLCYLFTLCFMWCQIYFYFTIS